MSRGRDGVIVRASAGTGKTHRLAVRCIELMARGERIDSVLATTFTRKAAGEIRERVLGMLSRAASGAPGAVEAIAEHAPGFTAARARALLVDAVSSMHRMQIMTIDALAARMATMVQLEVGLPPGWSVIDDFADAALRERALDRALEETGAAGMVALLHDLHGGAMRATVRETVLDLVGQAEGAWRDARGDAGVWAKVPEPAGRLADAEADLAVEALGATPVGVLTKAGGVDTRWEKAHRSAVECARERAWGEFLKCRVCEIALEEGGVYYGTLMPEGLRRAYAPVIRHAAAVLVGRHIARTRALEALVSRFVPAYEAIKREAGVVRFEDVPRALLGHDDAGTRESMYFRLDTRFRHVLLDEFQDTSAEQFAMVEPMVSEILAGGEGDRSVLIVGDPKQTLYSWRNAAPGLMEQVAKRWPEGFSVHEMHESRRSSPAILEAVNLVFGGLDRVEQLADSEAAARMQRGFVPHTAVKQWLPGEARVVEIGEPELRNEEERAAPPKKWALAAADAVQAIQREHPEWTIGVLTRKGKAAGAIISVLRGRGVFASAERGVPLGDCPAVAAFASLLTAIDHPGHTVAVYHVATSPVGRALGVEQFGDGARVREALDRLRMEIADRGVAAVAARALARAAGDMDARSFRRFEQLIEMCEEFDADPDVRLVTLAERIWETPVEDPSGSRVRVMTVHAAKGLEFDAVVLPELHDTWTVKDSVLVDQPDPLEPPVAICASAGDVVRRFSPEVEAIWRAAQERRFEDELCGLYVAMTRARMRLEVLVPPRTKAEQGGKSSSSVHGGRVIRAAMGLGDADAEGVLWRRVHAGDPSRVAALEKREEAVVREVEAPRFVRDRDAQPTWRAERKAPSGGGQESAGLWVVRAAGEGPGSDMGARIGDVVHEAFARVLWIEEGGEAVTLGPGVGIDAEVMARVSSRFSASVRSAAFRSVLSREAVAARMGGAVEVRTEMPFLVRESRGREGSVMSGRFDRVMVSREGGRARRVEIVDYKTDGVQGDVDAWVAERMRAHGPQMRAYRRAAASLFGTPEEAVRVWLAFVSAERVAEVVFDRSDQ